MAQLPGGRAVEGGSIFRLPVYLPDSAWHGHPSFTVRWPGVLAGDKTLIEGAFPMVAHRHGTGTNAASAPGATAARGRQS